VPRPKEKNRGQALLKHGKVHNNNSIFFKNITDQHIEAKKN
jgi:hypothetical protein